MSKRSSLLKRVIFGVAGSARHALHRSKITLKTAVSTTLRDGKREHAEQLLIYVTVQRSSACTNQRDQSCDGELRLAVAGMSPYEFSEFFPVIESWDCSPGRPRAKATGRETPWPNTQSPLKGAESGKSMAEVVAESSGAPFRGDAN